MQAKYLANTQPSRVLTLLDSPKGSSIWNFMMDSRNLISKYVSWEINNGLSANLWTDSWCGYPPIAQLDNMANIMDIAISHWGIKLSDYVSAVEIFSRKIIWKDPTLLPIPLQQASSLANILLKRIVIMSNRDNV